MLAAAKGGDLEDVVQQFERILIHQNKRKRCLLPIELFVFEAVVTLHSAAESGRRVEWVPRMKSRKSG
jgi:hypothetical protein